MTPLKIVIYSVASVGCVVAGETVALVKCRDVIGSVVFGTVAAIMLVCAVLAMRRA
jgi:hypothetical protein